MRFAGRAVELHARRRVDRVSKETVARMRVPEHWVPTAQRVLVCTHARMVAALVAHGKHACTSTQGKEHRGTGEGDKEKDEKGKEGRSARGREGGRVGRLEGGRGRRGKHGEME